MKVTDLANTPASPVAMAGVAGVSKQVPLGVADGAPTFSFRVFTIEPGGHTPLHTHDGVEHLNYVISGSGEVQSKEGPRPITQGSFVLVEPGELHQYCNTGSEPLVVICAVPKSYE